MNFLRTKIQQYFSFAETKKIMSTGSKDDNKFFQQQMKAILNIPEFHTGIQNFLQLVRQEGSALNDYYSWEKADKNIENYLLNKFARIIIDSERANRCYILLQVSKKISQPQLRRPSTPSLFFLDTERKSEDIYKIFSREFNSICAGYNIDPEAETNTKLFCYVDKFFGDILYLLLRQEITNSMILPKDILLLINDYANHEEKDNIKKRCGYGYKLSLELI